MHKILLIDLDKKSSNQIKVKIDWPHHGYIIKDAPNTTSDSLSLINRNDYDLYLLNLAHLDFIGIELCKQIRQVTTKPILLLGGEKDFNLVRKAMNLQVNDYLPSPIDKNELINSLQSLKQVIEDDQVRTKQKMLWNQKLDQTNKVSNIIDLVKNYVEHSIHENITLKEISDNLHYNPSYLGQKFKSEEKMTFNQYLLNRRMEKAQFLLSHTDMKIYEIAAEVGYTDLDWFYKKFKCHTGVSASVYRNQEAETNYDESQTV